MAHLHLQIIGVQRSGISHLLSGRNKPSLDFVLKISEGFPDIDLYWLLNGKGAFLKKDFPPAPVAVPEKQDDPGNGITGQDTTSKNNDAPGPGAALYKTGAAIYKVVIFYNDGSFRDFFPAQ